MEAVGDVLGFAVCVVLVRYGVAMAYDSWRLGAITIKNLVFPEWWLLAPLPTDFRRCSRSNSCSAFDRLLQGRADAAHRGHLGGLNRMSWVDRSLLLFGGLVAVMGLGLPVAFAFLRSTSSARALPRRRAGPRPTRPQCSAVGHQLFAHADPVLRADGRGAVSHRRRDQGDRRLRAADPPRARPARRSSRSSPARSSRRSRARPSPPPRCSAA